MQKQVNERESVSITVIKIASDPLHELFLKR